MDYGLLMRTPLFKDLDAEQLDQLFSQLHIGSVEFVKGDIIAMQDEPINSLIILLKGSVKAEMLSPSGKFVKVEDIYAPNPLAILFVFGTVSNRFPVHVTAREEVEAVVIPKQFLLDMLSMNQTLLKNYLDISADFALRLSRKLRFLSLNTIRQKIALYLIDQSRQQESMNVTLSMSKTALAEYFGVSRPSLERELTNMANEGLIASGRKVITINNRQELASLLN